ncbi:MAG: amino-acid N-acetyltransferase, partial [Thiothrix sp.]
GLKSLFVLSTHTMHWFQERGYQAGEIEQLPIQRAELYNYQRKSRIFLKTLTEERA